MRRLQTWVPRGHPANPRAQGSHWLKNALFHKFQFHSERLLERTIGPAAGQAWGCILVRSKLSYLLSLFTVSSHQSSCSFAFSKVTIHGSDMAVMAPGAVSPELGPPHSSVHVQSTRVPRSTRTAEMTNHGPPWPLAAHIMFDAPHGLPGASFRS